MRSRVVSLPGLLMVLVLVLGSLPGTAMAISRQFDNGSYQSPQYGYQVEWSSDWAPRERDSSSVRRGPDTMVLSTNAGRLQVIGQPNDIDVALLLLETIDRLSAGAGEVTISQNDPTLTVPASEITVGNTTYMIEVHDLGDTLVSVILSARQANVDTALTLAQDGVTLNGTPLFSGERAEPGDSTVDDGPGAGLDGTTFTSPTYGFAVGWDDAWEASEHLEDDREFVLLTSSTGSITVLGTRQYAGDAAACLDGESDFFGNEDPNIIDWEPAVDREGNEIVSRSETFAHGIFTFAAGGEEDGYVDQVDYIECRTLIPGEATMIVLVSSTPDRFVDHLEVALEITNAIEMPAGSELAVPADPAIPDLDQQAAATEPADPAATPAATGESGFDDATFTSPGFGFTFTVPDGWLVISEAIADGDERLQVTNGTSLITIRATDAISGEATTCIGAMETEAKSDPLHATLQLDTTTDGTPFQGADDRGAYALFTYTSDDGSEWAYFVRCEPLVAGESMLIIVQDVPYEDYVTERQARRIIQNAIERP